MNLLFIKIGAIGDVVTALRSIQDFQTADPSHSITWLCGQTVEPFIQKYCPKIKTIPVNESALFGSLGKHPLRTSLEILNIWKRLAPLKFDAIAIAYRDRRYEILCLPCRGRRVRLGGYRKSPSPFRGTEYLELLARATSTSTPTPTRSANPQNRKSLNVPSRIAIAPGGAKNILSDDKLRRWPVDSYRNLAKKLVQKGHRVVVVGSPSDEWVLPYFDGIDFENRVGTTSVLELIDLLAQCDRMVTHDSGPLHLGAFAGVPLVALFGPTNPEEVLAPSTNISVLWGGSTLSCRPCYDGKRYADCDDNQCLKSVTVEEVMNALN